MSVYYRELLIFDKEKKKARKIVFQNGINLVTSKLNSVGKSSLSLMILYAFGAKVKFSDKWNLNNIFTKLTLQYGDKEIIIIRYRDTYSIIAGGEIFSYTIQKHGYSEKLYELLGLTIKIKDKNSDSYSTAVPSLYLLPYYISQTKTDEDRSIFMDLNMYLKSDLYDSLYYHVGALDDNYSWAVTELSQTKKTLEKLRKDKETQSAEILYLEKKLSQNKNSKMVDCDKDLETDIILYEKYAQKKSDYYVLTKEAADIKHKIKLLNKTISDNSVYTNKLLEEEEIRCPVCKSDITDFISSALTIGLAETEINAELAELKANLLDVNRKIVLAKTRLDELQSSILTVEQQRESIKVTRAIIVWNEELKKMKESFSETQLKIDNYEQKIRELGKQIKKYSEKKKNADNAYRTSLIKLLNDTNVNIDEIDFDSLNLYDSVSLGGSEIPRVAISRFFAMLESKSKDSIVMPIIFDFPNIDLNEDNLAKCFKVMCDKISDTVLYPQSFVFSIDCEERIEKSGSSLPNANIIKMEELAMDDKIHPQLLCEYDYENNLEEIKQMINIGDTYK